MAEEVFKLIPEDPFFVPAVESRDAAVEILRGLYPHARRLQALLRREAAFIDPGQNLEAIACPLCGAAISPLNWQNAVEAAARTRFGDLGMSTPCCAKPSSLNALVYRGAAGFAKFSLEIRDPGGEPPGEADLRRLAEAVGSPLRAIRARY